MACRWRVRVSSDQGKFALCTPWQAFFAVSEGNRRPDFGGEAKKAGSSRRSGCAGKRLSPARCASARGKSAIRTLKQSLFTEFFRISGIFGVDKSKARCYNSAYKSNAMIRNSKCRFCQSERCRSVQGIGQAVPNSPWSSCPKSSESRSRRELPSQS